MSVIQQQATPDTARRPSQVEDAYAHYRLDRQGDPVSPNTLELYEHTVGRFLRWLRNEHPDVRRFEDLKVLAVREYRAQLAARPGLRGKPIQPETLAGADRAMRAFFRWADSEGYPVDPRILQLRKVRIPRKEPTLFHIKQLNDILAACNPRLPQEAMAVRILIGAGLRRSELCGHTIEGPDGLPDLMLDSLDRGVVELRVRGESGAKGLRARRVPIVPKLGAEIKRYIAKHRIESRYPNLLINRDGRPYGRWGIDAMMDRLSERVEFRVHAHAFRHTFGTVATKLGWNLERLRAAMGHERYETLQGYVRMATERDLGDLDLWTKLIAEPPQVGTRGSLRWQ